MGISMTQWEYKIISCKTVVCAKDVPHSEIEQTLNDAGKDGWEVICAIGSDYSYGANVILKRPLQ